ncbi:MAG: ribulose-bisphosphate carboxylase large subunit family protein [Rhizobiaceae bacterium]|nr:ribulose-bisphosphate carboxylase large subunit family protein [Rhizobiaceae bacterium]
MSRFEADYILETAYGLAEAAAAIAGEQSSGTFMALPGETPELKARSAARVEVLEDLGPVDGPSLPGAGRADRPHRRAKMTISWPLATIGPSLPNLMATVAGNLFELRQVSGLRLTALRLPPEFAANHLGPAFGVDGTRQLTDVYGRPLIGTIIKPSVGLSPDETAGLVDQLCTAGIDFIKDDELQADGPACPFEVRVKAVMAVINRHGDKTGKKVMYAFNLTGDVDEMRARHDTVEALGGTCVMASLNSVGLAGMLALRKHARLPIHAHRNGWGYLSRAPMLGFDYTAWQVIWRLAGVDHMHVNGLQNKFCEPDDSVIASARACLTPLWPGDPSLPPCTVMPVFSSGQSVAQVHDTFRVMGTTDLIHAAGGGIMGHPQGAAGGVAAMRAAWEAAAAGISLDVAAREHSALAQAVKFAR